MIRIFFVVAVLMGLYGCSSAPNKIPNPFAPYQLMSPEKTAYDGKKNYRLGGINVTLDQMRINERFPDAKGLEQIFSAMLTDRLEKIGALAAPDSDAISLDLDITYKRIFFGEEFGFSKGFASSIFKYGSELKCGDKVCANYRSYEYFANKGLAGNLLKIGKQLTMTGSPDDELSEIAIYVDEIMNNLPK